MTESLRLCAAAFLASLAFALPARATSYSIDYSDLWWNAAESGWGVNVIQQNDILFLTFFVYGPDNTARWYSASSVTPTNPQPAGAARFSGALFQTTGPWFGGPFNTDNVARREAGAVTITFDSPDTGTLSYSVDGVQVVKAVRRYSFRGTSAGGTYVGGLVALASQCTQAADNGAFAILGATTVSQTDTQITLKVTFSSSTGAASSCTFVGPYTQNGRMGAVASGSFSCLVGTTAANAGVFTMSALDAQMNGFHATFSGRDQYCTYNGRFGGTRDATG